MVSENEFKRICWACRRGMLELDLVMEPFVKECFRDLAEEDQQRFITLLECEDTELFSWFLGRVEPEDPELCKIVRIINAHAKAASS
jgi:antitoxin CptB